MKDETLFPPRCCKQRIPIALITPLLTERRKVLFEQKEKEFGTPALERIYCPTPTCSLFLGSSKVVDGRTATALLNFYGSSVASSSSATLPPPYSPFPSSTGSHTATHSLRCTKCNIDVCKHCKRLGHNYPLRSCASVVPSPAESKNMKALRDLAKVEGWQTCPGCRSMVELNHGCYHMTCRCGFQFCYICAVKWKACRCPQWDEGRLLETAERRVRDQFGERPREGARLLPAAVATTVRRGAFGNVVEQQQQHPARTMDWGDLVRQTVGMLRENHDCERHVFRKRDGGGNCEECHDYLRDFLLVRDPLPSCCKPFGLVVGKLNYVFFLGLLQLQIDGLCPLL